MKDWLKWVAGGIAGVFLLVPMAPVMADDGDGWAIKSKADEEVRFRPSTGLSKARTLGQSDIDRKLNGGDTFSVLKFHTTLRASYDAAYDLNTSRYGDSAGGKVYFTDLSGNTYPEGAGGAAGHNARANRNEGLMKMSDLARGADNGVDFAVPVRPCDVDKRGCIPGYMDASKLGLAAPEFNNRLDAIRELYVDGEIPVAGNTLAIRFGRQQLVWGRTDLFRVLDVVNPVDYSRNNIYDELSDIRIPMGMIRADYRMGSRGPFDDLNFQGLWVWEKFRPNNLGQGGSPNNPLGAAAFFRGMKNCWDNGCTVNNFFNGNTATNFGPHQIGIRQANMPDWSFANTTYGGKVEGEFRGVGFSINGLHTVSQMPSLRGGITSADPFNTSTPGVYTSALAWDMEFPQLTVLGASADFTIDPIDTAFRLETSYTMGEEFANTARSRLYSESDVLRYVVGADKNIFIRPLNSSRAFLFSGQAFGQHILQHELHHINGVTSGIPDWQSNWIATLLVKGWYMGDTLSPQMVFARDMMARANVVEPSVEWTPAAMWRFRLGANVKVGESRQSFDDNRSAKPYTAIGGPAISTGSLAGMYPLGSFRSGVIGAAHDETEIFANVTMRF